jgi:HlyD family secretion protein
VELAEAQLAQEMMIRDQKEGMEKRVANKQVEAYQAALSAAQDDQRSAETLLNWLWAIRSNPLGLIAQANMAEGKYQVAEAGVKVAQEQLNDVLAGPTQEEIAVAEAALHKAEADVRFLQTEVERYTLSSPIDGVVVSQVMQPGELASSAATILTVADLSQVDLMAYVLEYRIGEVQLGQTVQVTVDSFPGRVFEGTVTKIGNEPEYTPRNLTTVEQRRNTYYQVEIRLPNPENVLKAGMPADVTF